MGHSYSPPPSNLNRDIHFEKSPKKEHEPLVTEKMIRATTTLTGTRDEIIEAINNMERAGIKQVAIQSTSDPRGTIESFSREIMKMK
jgi:2-iminoacetate synthase ThiH